MVAQQDVYGSPLAPVGTSAPVPQDILNQINSIDREADVGFSGDGDAPQGELVSLTEEDEIEEEVINELVDQIKKELDDPSIIKNPDEEKFLQEVINTIEYIENDPNNGEGAGDVLSTGRDNEDQDAYGGQIGLDNRGNAIDDAPLFDNVRDTVADPPATGTPGPTIEIDLGGQFVDLSNDVLSNGRSTSSDGEINLTGTTTPASVNEEVTIAGSDDKEYNDYTYDDGDQRVSASTPQPQYQSNEVYDDVYDNADEDEEDVDVTNLSEDYGEGEQGYDIRVPDTPLDSSLSGNYILNVVYP